jgi:hypothetical protein
MALQKRSGLFALVALAVGLTAVRADAGLIGADLGWQYYGGGGAYNPSTAGSETNGSFTDTGSGVGGTFIEPISNTLETVFNIDATDTTITFDYSVDTASGPWSGSPLSLSPTIDNGIAISLLSAGSFADVSIDPATNMTGFDSSDLSFTASQIQVNWANLDFDASTVVALDVTYSETSATPEPATYSLVILSLLGTVLAARSGLKLR